MARRVNCGQETMGFGLVEEGKTLVVGRLTDGLGPAGLGPGCGEGCMQASRHAGE